MSTQSKSASMTTWTSSAPTTPMARCHHMQQSAMCCTWWRGRTTRCVSLTPLTSCVGSAHGHSPPMPLKNSLRSSSASPPSPWARSLDKERAIIISVSINHWIYFPSGYSDHQKVSCIQSFSLSGPLQPSQCITMARIV